MVWECALVAVPVIAIMAFWGIGADLGSEMLEVLSSCLDRQGRGVDWRANARAAYPRLMVVWPLVQFPFLVFVGAMYCYDSVRHAREPRPEKSFVVGWVGSVLWLCQLRGVLKPKQAARAWLNVLHEHSQDVYIYAERLRARSPAADGELVGLCVECHAPVWRAGDEDWCSSCVLPAEDEQHPTQ